MNKYTFGITTKRPSRAAAARMDKICKEEGGDGFTEVNSGGRYQGWFIAQNNGEPFNSDIRARVLARVSAFTS